ncbi:GNAT family N-acetyltransferase [Streptomyces sp. BI20]|uniref:GNAT family N-acetyltransferase n=1 Tax=Streptomyces sp. BI20 TaxID=3403460 RepID=UPI003C73907E
MIRIALPADVDRIAALHVRARATYYRDRVPEAAYAGAAERERTREGWTRAVARGGVLCAEEDGVLLGIAAHRTDPAGVTTLTQLHVDPRHWRRGTGAALHAACVERWRAAGVRRVRLEVYAPNARARSFYEALGWVPAPGPQPGATHRELLLDLPAPAPATAAS